MKTSLFTKTKRILSLVLCLCLVWTMVPGQTMGVYAAGVASGPMIPEFGVTTNDLWCCFANGTPITIEEGTESGTAIYYYENGNRVYLNPEGAGGDDLSELVVFGGSRSYDILKSDTSVTMIGGQVKAIYAAQIWGDVEGSASVFVTSSAKVEQVVMRSYFDGDVDGDTFAFVINGAKLSGKLNNYLYKNGSQWEIVGQMFLPAHEHLSFDSNATVTIRDGQFESVGTIGNFGTVVIHETAEFINSGTFYNSGTIEAHSIIQGNIPSGSINYLLPYIPFTETAADVDLSVSVNGVHVENPEYAIYNDRLWLETKPGEIVAELNGVKYYGTYEKGSAAELKPFVSVERVEVTFAPSGQHVNGPIYKIYTKAEPEDATYQTPSFALESTDGAFITNGNELVVSKGGTYTVNVTIPKGRDGTNDFTSTADFTYEFIEVEDIDFTLKEIEVGETASLSRHKVITPSNATSDSCRYDIISGDAAVIEDYDIRGVKEGKVTLRVTAICAEGWNHPKYEDFEITVKHIPVTEIPGVPEQLTANNSVQLPAKALPENSTSRDIVWSIADGAEATGASLNGNVLSVTKAGTLTLEATVKDGLAEGKDFVQTYEIRVNYIPVTTIPEIPTELSAYAALELPAKALPENASSRDIVWTITEGASDSDAIINENVLVAKKAGTLKLKATVKDGTDSGTNFEQEYTVTVKENTALDITKGSIVITEEDDTHNRIKFQGFAEDAIWSKDTAVILTGSVTITRGMGSFLTVDGTSANIVLDDVKIEMPDNSTIESPNSIQLANGATVEMDLKGDNSIDGGYNKSAVFVPEGTSLTIDSSFGGSLTAEATGFGAAIGGGKKEAAGTITINGGTVTARTSNRGAAIGGGGEAAGTVNVIINGGNVTAEATGYYGAAAIGSAYDSSSSVNVIIHGGTVRADAASGAAIGSGFSSSSSVNVIIRGGTVTAAGVNGAGIGSHTHSTGNISIVVTGGNINASSSKGNAVGNGYAAKGNVSLTNGTDNVFLRTITLHGAESNTGITDMDIGYGLKDVKTLEGGNLYFYLPADPEVNSITAGDTEYICKNSSLVYYSEHDWSNGVCSRCGEVCSHEGETGANCNVCGKSLHIHSWIYTAVGNTINAVCTAANCEFTDGNGGSVSIAAPADLTYTGSAIEAAVTDNLKTGDTITVVYSGDLTDGYPVNAGDYTATIKLDGKTISAEYTINPASIADAVVTAEPSEMTYSGQAHEPGVTVTLDGKILTGGTDYTVSYSDNINAGTAKAAVTGKGNYTGTAAVEFTIAKAVPAASDFTFAAPEDLTFTGSAKSASVMPVPSISGMGSVTVKYEKEGMEAAPVNAGTYTVKIEVAEGTNYTAAHGLTDVAWTFTIAKAEASYKAPAAQNYLKYNGAAQALVTAGSTDHGTMMYKLDNGQWSSEVPSAVNAGEYTVSYYVAGDENHNDSAEGSVTVNIAKAVPALGTVSAVIEANKTSAAEIVISRSDETVPGKLAIDPATKDLVWGNNLVGYTFEPDDTANYRTITAGLITVVVTDTLAPTGEVKLETNSWKELVNNVTFGLFFNRNVELEVSAEDALSGVKTIEYLAASEAMTEDAVKAAEGWKAVGADGKIGVTAADAEKSVYYIRITDNAGNMVYLSTDGMVFDLIAPVITGVTDGGVYYTTQKVQISDANLADGIEAEQTLAGNVDTTYEVEAADKAGNTAKVTITMKPISTLSEVIKDLTEGNVTGDSSDELAAVEEALAAVDTANATEAEKQALEDAKANVDALQKVIEDAKEAVDNLDEAVTKVDPETITSDDKASVEELIEDLQEQLNHPNLTEAQKQQVQDAIDKAEDILDKIAADQKTLEDALKDVEDITADGVTADDSADLAAARDKLEELKADDNYTEAEKEEIQKEIDRITELEDVIAQEAEEVAALKKEAADLNPDTITRADKEAVEELISEIEAKKSDANLTEEQKAELDEAIEDAQEILDKIVADQQAMTDALEAVKDITEEDLKASNLVVKEHKTKLEEAKKTLETLLNDENYTAEEKAAMQEELDRIQELIKTADKQLSYNSIPEVQKPKVETTEGAEVELSSNGTKAEITVKEGYELEDVLVNGESQGKVTTLTGLKTGDKVQVLVKKMKSAEEILMGELDNIQLTARSKSTKLNGKKAIKIWWYEADSDNIEFFDGYEVFRSTKRYSGFGKKPFFTTEKTFYTNNKDLKSGNTYYYKVRGYVELDGKKYYSDWSKKAWRTF